MRPETLVLPLVSLLAAACVTPGVTPMDTESDTGSTSETTTASTSTTTTSTTTTMTTTTTSTTTMVTTTSTMGVCGDGAVDAGEECDEGEANGDNAACTSACKVAACGDGFIRTGTEECDDGAANSDEGGCTSECKLAVCGDAKVYAGVEACDNGVNDGSYGTCNGDCTRAPHCGDGVVQEMFEACEGPDINSACLDDCTVAATCLDIIEQWPDAPTGVYTVDPPSPEVSSLDVYCEMEADGGGYTMIKVDRLPAVTGGEADEFCAGYGMRLVVPRTEAHLLAIHEFATVQNLPPIAVGMGMSELPASDEYLSILGIYPKVAGQSCVSQPFNSAECPEWRANDDGPFWVSDIPIATEPSTKNCLGCSMVYTWKVDGSLDAYQAFTFNGGYNAQWFICHADDKK